MANTGRILVAGDCGLNYDIYLKSGFDSRSVDMQAARVSVSPGGSVSVFRMLEAVKAHLDSACEAGLERPNLEIAHAARPEDGVSSPNASLWQKARLGKCGRTPADENRDVWRLARALSLGAGAAGMARPPDWEPAAPPEGFQPSVILVEDNVRACRFRTPEWLAGYSGRDDAPLPDWVILDTSSPLCQGALWWGMMEARAIRDRLVVVAPASAVRESETRISKGISWERSAQDLLRELAMNARLEGLRMARHLIVTFGGDGALWVSRHGEWADGAYDATLVFDAAFMEDEWFREFCGGEAASHGFKSAFAASVATRLAVFGENGIADGIEAGLRAGRLRGLLGHGPADNDSPGLPVKAIAAVMTPGGPAPDRTAPGPASMVDTVRLGCFGRAAVPQVGRGGTWRLLEASGNSAAPDLPLFGLGRRIALTGLAGLEDVPYACFGALFTADRDEIEALRDMQRLMRDYEASRSETRPLSIAVFGPPGAGKSFGIKQIAKTALKGRVDVLEFNLSQFNSAEDLIGAFHQVRDKVLEGALPVVFWDEFDSQGYRWLQYLLAPMQDGKFQEGQLTHPIGRAIFVFAGATSYDLESFGPPQPGADVSCDVASGMRAALDDFRLKKGPDFKSRLHGNLNVLGPNPRQVMKVTAAGLVQWHDDPTDVCFPVRRAILLRAWMGKMDPAKRSVRDRLDIDPGLLAAIIEVGHYRHGARSMEKLVAALKRDVSGALRRAGLPSEGAMAMLVEDPAEFFALLEDSRSFQSHAWRLAPAIHAAWYPLADQENQYRTGFEKLNEEGRADNFAAALRIPSILGLVGLRLVEENDPDSAAADDVKNAIERHMELLAEEEHNGWMTVKLANGWKPAPVPADATERAAQRAAMKHHCLVPYRELADSDKEKDRVSVRNYPTVARLAGFRIVAGR